MGTSEGQHEVLGYILRIVLNLWNSLHSQSADVQ